MAEPTVVAFPHDERAAPPARFSPAEAETWKAVIGSRPAGHFGPEVFALVEAYCTTALLCDDVAARMRTEEGVDVALLDGDEYRGLLTTYGELSDSLIDLAAALGILPAGGKRRRDVDDVGA